MTAACLQTTHAVAAVPILLLLLLLLILQARMLLLLPLETSLLLTLPLLQLLLQPRQRLRPVTWLLLLLPYHVTAVPLLRQPHSRRAWRLLGMLLMPRFLLLLLLLLWVQGWQLLQSRTVAVPACARADVADDVGADVSINVMAAAAVHQCQVPSP
jgi:hypothetical protein